MIKHKNIDNSILRRPMLPVLALVVGGAALVVAAILAVSLVDTRERLDSYSKQQMYNNSSSSYWTSRLSFCYDNSLNPCTDEVIEAWNKAYPDDTFSLTPPQS